MDPAGPGPGSGGAGAGAGAVRLLLAEGRAAVRGLAAGGPPPPGSWFLVKRLPLPPRPGGGGPERHVLAAFDGANGFLRALVGPFAAGAGDAAEADRVVAATCAACAFPAPGSGDPMRPETVLLQEAVAGGGTPAAVAALEALGLFVEEEDGSVLEYFEDAEADAEAEAAADAEALPPAPPAEAGGPGIGALPRFAALKAAARRAFRAGDFRGALRLFGEANALSARSELCCDVSLCLFKLGDFAAALRAAEQAVALSPGWALGHVRKGKALERLARPAAAAEAYRAALGCDRRPSGYAAALEKMLRYAVMQSHSSGGGGGGRPDIDAVLESK